MPFGAPRIIYQWVKCIADCSVADGKPSIKETQSKLIRNGLEILIVSVAHGVLFDLGQKVLLQLRVLLFLQ